MDSSPRRSLVRWLVPLGGLVLLIGAGLYWRDATVEWFAPIIPDRWTGEAGPTPGDGEAEPLPSAVLDPLREAFESVEELRAHLARDEMEGVAETSAELLADLRSAQAEMPGARERAASAVDRAIGGAEGVEAASDAEEARTTFVELNAGLVVLGGLDARLTEGWHVFHCPMAPEPGAWIQRSAEISNPYMGERMPRCGTETTWAEAVEPPGSDGEEAEEGEIAYWTCSMHPSVQEDSAEATCPICSMDLAPVTRESLETGEVLVDAVRRQRIGVTTAPVERRPLTVSVRAPGIVRWNEQGLHDVTLRVEGWIEELHVDRTGQRVERGDPLLTLYSPELYATQGELLSLVDGEGEERPRLVESARQRLLLLGLLPEQVDAILRDGRARRTVEIRAPVGGRVIAKEVVEGARVSPGHRLYRIADPGTVWVEADLYGSQMGLVEPGRPVHVTLPYRPDRPLEGTIDFVYPWMEMASRTTRVRVVCANPDLALRPGMWSTVRIDVELGPRLVVPVDAVIYTGTHRLVFVDRGEGRLVPRPIEIGHRGREGIEVLSGLEEGEVVVASGNFLIAAESRIKSATGYWGASDAGE